MVTKELNLLIDEKSKNNRSLTLFILLGVLIFCSLIVFLYVIPQINIKALKTKDYKLTEEINRIGDINDIVKEYNQKMDSLKNKQDSLAAINVEKIDLMGLLEKIKLLIPDKVYITQLSVASGSSINVSFETTEPIQIVQLYVKLRESGMFENVELNSVPLETGTPQSINFSLQPKITKKDE